MYVMRIHTYVCESYHTYYEKIWQQVINSPLFEESLLFKQGKRRGHCNTYVVHSIVCWMLESGMYKKGCTMLQLHFALEQRTKQGPEYKAITGRYALVREQRAFLRNLFKEILQSTF